MKVFGALFISLIFFACAGDKRDTKSSQEETKVTKIARVSQEPGTVHISGTIRSQDTASIASRSGGFLIDVPARPGMHVKKGELLVLMDDRSLNAQSGRLAGMKEEMQQGLAEAESQLKAAAAQKQLADSTFQRMSNLYDKKSSSRQEYEEALSRRDAAGAQWNAAKQRVAQAESRLQQLKSEGQELSANLSYARITAPFDGVVTSVSADEGTFVNPGQVLAAIERPDVYQIIFTAEQELLPLLKVGDSLHVEIAGLKDPQAKAIVSEINTSIDPATRTFLIKADLSNSNGAIRSGISATAILNLPARSSLWIPEEFLNSTSGLETVTVRRGDQWERTLVRSGKRNSGKIEIVSGLNAGEEIAIPEK